MASEGTALISPRWAHQRSCSVLHKLVMREPGLPEAKLRIDDKSDALCRSSPDGGGLAGKAGATPLRDRDWNITGEAAQGPGCCGYCVHAGVGLGVLPRSGKYGGYHHCQHPLWRAAIIQPLLCPCACASLAPLSWLPSTSPTSKLPSITGGTVRPHHPMGWVWRLRSRPWGRSMR